MPAPAHNKLIVSGTLPGSEVWATGISWRSSSGVNLINFSALDAALNDDTTGGTWATALAALLAGANGNVAATKLTLQYLDATGRVASSSNRGTSTVGGLTASTSALPNECAVVASLRTTQPGARGRGRMYLPWNQVSRNSDGTLALASTIGTNVKTFFAKVRATLNAQPTGGADFLPVVASAAGGGNLYIVTNILSGNIIDSQRRRRNRQQEVYSNVAFP